MPNLNQTILLIRFSGLRHVARILRYTRYKENLDRRYNRPPSQKPNELPAPTLDPGLLMRTVSIPGGARFRFELAELELVFLAPDLLRLDWQPGPNPEPANYLQGVPLTGTMFQSGTLLRRRPPPARGRQPVEDRQSAVAPPPEPEPAAEPELTVVQIPPPPPYALARPDWPVLEVALKQLPEGWQVKSDALHVLVKLDGSLEFTDPTGLVLRRELPPLRNTSEWTHSARLALEERLYGLGEQTGRLDLRGRSYRIWNSDPGGSYGPGTDPIYMPLPLYLGLHRQGSYLVFYENSFPATFTLKAADPQAGPADYTANLAEAHFEGGRLRYYFIPGPPARALERYTELTGRAALPPLWSLGYHQCRWGYKDAADIRAVAAGFRQHDLPLSAIHLDIDYMDGFRVFTVDRARFPDLAGLAQELGEQGIRLVTIVDPGVKQDAGYRLYQEGLKAGFFCTAANGRPMIGIVWPGWCAFPDFTDPRVRTWWGEQYLPLLEAGIAGFWHDMNEPASFSAGGDLTLPLVTGCHLEGQGGDHRQFHNLYGLLMNRSAHEALRQHRPDSRPWIISRAGWAGSQRYAWNWTGDTESSWPALRMIIPSLLGLGLSGQPFSGPDIGGFSGSPSAELYLRSFQMAAFLPFFRTHSAIGTARREPWVYGEPYTSILRRFLQLRERLLPYLYTLAWEAGQTGTPLIRPLFWHDLDDEELWSADDAFLLGAALLVAPVLEEAAERRAVRLPPGGWYDFWNSQLYQGSSQLTLPVDLERIPAFVRAGSLLPLAEDGRLALHVYPPAGDGGEAPIAGRLYSDAGDGYGPQRLDEFRLQRRGHRVTLTWSSAAGDYPFPYPEVTVVLHGTPTARARVDGRATACPYGRLQTGPFQTIQFDIA